MNTNPWKDPTDWYFGSMMTSFQLWDSSFELASAKSLLRRFDAELVCPKRWKSDPCRTDRSLVSDLSKSYSDRGRTNHCSSRKRWSTAFCSSTLCWLSFLLRLYPKVFRRRSLRFDQLSPVRTELLWLFRSPSDVGQSTDFSQDFLFRLDLVSVKQRLQKVLDGTSVRRLTTKTKNFHFLLHSSVLDCPTKKRETTIKAEVFLRTQVDLFPYRTDS